MHNDLGNLTVAVTVLFLSACSAAPKLEPTTKSEMKAASRPADLVSGRTAFWEMYKAANAWAEDVVPLVLESNSISVIQIEAGKAEMWSATFGSPSRHEARTFSYSISTRISDISKRVMVGHTFPWTGPARDLMPFEQSEFLVDSDTAYQIASAAAEGWLKRHPNKEASLSLRNVFRFKRAVWYVLWGEKKSGYALYVNASTGDVNK